MSISTHDASVPASTTPNRALADDKPLVKPDGPAPAGLSFKDHATVTVSFHSHEKKSGPVFSDPHAPVERQMPGQNKVSMLHSFLNGLKDWITSLFSGFRPPMHPGCGSKPPPRPNPSESSPPPRPTPTVGRPFPTPPGGVDTQYSLKSNEQLAQQLLDNFRAFRDPKNPGYISADSIHEMANKKCSSDPVMNENIRLAKEMLRRPELMNAIDRHSSTGALDGLIDRENLRLVINGGNYFKYHSDKDVVQELLEHFKELRGSQWDLSLQVNDLKQLAASTLTGDSEKDHLIQLAQEMLKRSDLVTKLDNLASQDRDGRISLLALLLASR
jgi:hypothetical protein